MAGNDANSSEADSTELEGLSDKQLSWKGYTRCTQCGLAKPTSECMVKRVRFAPAGRNAKGKQVNRTIAKLCAECLEEDPHWNTPERWA